MSFLVIEVMEFLKVDLVSKVVLDHLELWLVEEW